MTNSPPLAFSVILFDMNGVIVDDEHLHELAFANVLREHGYKLDHETYERCFMGRTDKDGFESFFGMHRTSFPNPPQLLSEKSDAYHDLAKGNLSPYPGVVEFIYDLSAHTVPMALVTSSSRIEADAVLGAFKLDHAFPVRVHADDVAKGKPHPEGYLKGAGRLDASPHTCLVVEDAPSGIDAAHRAGMTCIAVTNTRPSTELSGADRIVTRLDVEFARELLSFRI
jgi:HAD superfamily hydrolase (TIGR01509 family)